MKNTCIFCSIVETKTPQHEIIWEDKKHMAFLDKYPSKEGHTLVIPKKHSARHLDLNEDEYIELFLAVQKVAHLLDAKTSSHTIAMVIEGLSVPHTHVHLVPLKKGEKLAHFENIEKTQEELKAFADGIRN